MTRATIAIALALTSARAATAEVAPYAGVAVEQLYDSNVRNGQGADAVSRVSPRIGLHAAGPAGAAGAEYLVALHAYARGTAEASANHRAALWGRFAATRRLSLAGRAVLLVVDDPVLLERAGVAAPDGGLVDLAVDARATHRLARRWTLDGGYAGRATRFEQGGAFDGEEHRVDAGATVRLTRRADVGVRGRWQWFVAGEEPLDRVEDAPGATAAVSWRPARGWRARGEGGPVWIEGRVDATALGELIYTARRARARIVAARELYGATGSPRALRSDSIGIDASWRATRQLVARARTAVYRSVDAIDRTPQASGFVARASLGWSSSGGRWRIELYAEQRAQAAGTLVFDDVQRTLVGIRISALVGADPSSLEEDR